MGDTITMHTLPVVCNICKQTRQVPLWLAEATKAGVTFECIECKKKATHEYAKQYADKMMP